MIGIVIVAHGGLAQEYLFAVEHIVGKQLAIMAIAIDGNYNRAEKEAEICAAADSVDGGDGVVVVTDMFGGSPSNLSLLACSAKQRRIVYGANLPMLILLKCLILCFLKHLLQKERSMVVAESCLIFLFH